MAKKLVTNPKSYVICDQRRVRTDGTAPIRLIVKYQHVQKVYGLDIYMTQSDFNQTKKKNIGGNYSEEKLEDLKVLKKKIEDWERKAKEKIELIKDEFNFEEFSKLLFGDKENTLFIALEAKIKELNRQGRAGYANTYQGTLNTLKVFSGGVRKRTGGKKEGSGRKIFIEGGNDIPLKHVNKSFLNKFKDWYIGQVKKSGNTYSPTTFGIYCRNIRVVLNEAIGDHKIATHPFAGNNGFKIPGGRKRKLALKLEEVGKIMNAKLPLKTSPDRYRDYWIFLYLAGGMNVTDMAELIYGDIDSEKISYIRKKTALKEMQDPKFISIPLTQEIGRLIDKWGQKPALPETYVFPILKTGMTPQEERNAIVQATKNINKHIKNISEAIGLGSNVSTYTARHSFATILKNSGVSTEAISEALGHSHVKVTDSYLKEFEITEKAKQWENLMPKKK